MEPDVYISLEINPKEVARRLNRVLENQMPKFQPHDGDPRSVYFSENIELEVKTRSGQTYHGVTQPWLLIGWEHRDAPGDIMEYKVIKGSITKPKEKNTNG